MGIAPAAAGSIKNGFKPISMAGGGKSVGAEDAPRSISGVP